MSLSLDHSIMYRSNLPHHKLESCDGNCFDDLCKDCRAYTRCSDDESLPDLFASNPFDMNSLSLNLQQPTESYSSDGYSADEDTSSESDLFDPFAKELERQHQLLSEQVKSIEVNFQEFNNLIDRHEQRLNQLHRQNNHCCNLLSTFEDFLQSFEEETDSAVYCGDWFMTLDLLKVQLNFDSSNTELLIQRLNGKMKGLYNFFDGEKRLLNGTRANREQLSIQIRFVAGQIALAGFELDRLDDVLERQVQQRRDIIVQFVEVMASIVYAVQSSLVQNQIGEFDCFTGRYFLQEFNRTLNQIQII